MKKEMMKNWILALSLTLILTIGSLGFLSYYNYNNWKDMKIKFEDKNKKFEVLQKNHYKQNVEIGKLKYNYNTLQDEKENILNSYESTKIELEKEKEKWSSKDIIHIPSYNKGYQKGLNNKKSYNVIYEQNTCDYSNYVKTSKWNELVQNYNTLYNSYLNFAQTKTNYNPTTDIITCAGSLFSQTYIGCGNLLINSIKNLN